MKFFNSAVFHLSGRHSHKHFCRLIGTDCTSTPHFSALPIHDYAKLVSNHISDCTDLRHLQEIHAHVIRIDFLAQHPAPFHYNNLIRSYTSLNSPLSAQCLYLTMSRDNVTPDTYTLPILLKSLTQNFDGILLRQLHAVAFKNGLEENMYCESGFISLYCKAGEIKNARKVFDQNPERKLGSWNAIIAGLSQGGHAKEVIKMFIELMRSGFQPDDVTMVSVTSGCGSLGDLNLALQLHKCMFQAKTFERSDMLMMNSLVDMYGKCGRMDLANRVFLEMQEKNVSSWTSMIVGYAMHGHVRDALKCFEHMIDVGMRPNHVTFIGVLSACVHGGMVHEAKIYFKTMQDVYGITPKLQHYGCMIDLLGRVGLLEEAKETVDSMPVSANEVIWGSLMGACEKYGNVEMGEHVAKQLLELEPWNDGVYVALSNIYATNDLWEEVERLRRIMVEKNMTKIPSYSLS